MMQKVGGVWKHTKDNKTFLSGTVSIIAGLKHRVLIYPTPADKKGPKSPDYSVSVEALPIEPAEKKDATSSVKVTTSDI